MSNNNFFNLKSFFSKISDFEDKIAFDKYRENFLKFYYFLRDDYMNGNEILIFDTIDAYSMNEFYFNNIVFDKKYLREWNKIIVSHILHFWDYDGNRTELEAEFDKIKELQRKKSASFILNYFSLFDFKDKQERKEFDKTELFFRNEERSNENTTFFKILFISEHIPFFTKEILQTWISNLDLKFEKLFFNIGFDKEIPDLKLNIYQYIQNNSGIDKNINFHYRVNSKNSIVNTSNININYLPEVDDLKFYLLDNNFNSLQNELNDLNTEEEFRLFGNIYLELNTKQQYIIKMFVNFLNDLGISANEIHPDNMFDNKDMNIIDIHTLFKFNLSSGITKKDDF